MLIATGTALPVGRYPELERYLIETNERRDKA
jgi:hypothetical protein